MHPALQFLVGSLFFILIAYGIYRLATWLTLRGGREAKGEVEAALTRAAPAVASVVLSRQPQGVMRKPRAGSVRMLLTLEVLPASGASYRADTLWQVDVSALDRVQAGQTVAVKVDADEPAAVYPAEDWATYNWP